MFGGVPDPSGETVTVTKSGLDELTVYIHGLNAWIADAAECLR